MAGTTAFVALDKTVTISVDGQASSPELLRTVADLLGQQDLGRPRTTSCARPRRTDRRTASTWSVRFGRPVDLTVDGESRTVWTTARTCREALMMFGLRAEGA